MTNELTRDEQRNQAAPVRFGHPDDPAGWDGSVAESAEETKARKALEALYDIAPPTIEDDEDADPVDADRELLAAAQTMYDGSATPDEIEEARAILLESAGLADEVDDADDAPQTRAERVAEMADAVRQGMTPLSEYAEPGEVDAAVAHRSAVDAVAKEAAIQCEAKRALGVPGYDDASSPQGPRSPEDQAAIQAVREAMLRQKGIEPSDLMNPPLGDDLFDEAIAEGDADMDAQLELPPGTTAASFDDGGLAD